MPNIYPKSIYNRTYSLSREYTVEEDRLLRAPELLIPGKQPIGKLVKVDSSHNLGRHCVICSIPAIAPGNLANNGKYVLAPSGSILRTDTLYHKQKLVRQFTSPSHRQTIAARPGFDFTGPYTVALSAVSMTQDYQYLLVRYGGSYILVVNTGTGTSWSGFFSYTVTGGLTAPLCYTTNTSSSASKQFYVYYGNGVYTYVPNQVSPNTDSKYSLTTTSIYSTLAAVSSISPITVDLYIGGSTTEASNMSIEYFMIFNKTLSKSQLESLRFDPYQILRPV